MNEKWKHVSIGILIGLAMAYLWSQGVPQEMARRAGGVLLAAAPDLLAACVMGDSIGNGGLALLEYTADLVAGFAPATAEELRRKAAAERAAITRALGVPHRTEEEERGS